MGPFPMLESRALSLIGFGTLTAVLAGATKVITKTPHEAIGVPTKEANAKGLLCSRLMVETLTHQQPLDRAAVDREASWIQLAARGLIDRSLELGDGDFANSVTRAFEAGVMDLPFSPSEYANGDVLPIRDVEGAVRYLDCGGLPLEGEFLDRNESLVQERLESESGLEPTQLIERDVNYFIEHELLDESERLEL
jgi:methylaspartate mutase epsilon subunit